MPRRARSTPAGYCYHVLSRGNARQEVFHKDADYAAFIRLFDQAHERCPVRVLARMRGCTAGFRTVVTQLWYKWLRRRKRKPWPTWPWFTRLLERFPLPPAIPVHSVCRAAKA